MEPTGIQVAGVLGGLACPRSSSSRWWPLCFSAARKLGNSVKVLGEGIRNFKTALKAEDEGRRSRPRLQEPPAR